MKISFAIVSSLAAMASASAVAVSTASTMQAIIESFGKAEKNFARINDLLNGFPANGAKALAEIHEQETRMQAAITEVTTNLQLLSTPVSTTNVQKIIDSFQTVIPVATQSLNGIAAKATAFSALGTTTVNQLQSDVVGGDAVCRAVQLAINAIAPPAMFATLTPALDKVNAASTAALTALS